MNKVQVAWANARFWLRRGEAAQALRCLQKEAGCWATEVALRHLDRPGAYPAPSIQDAEYWISLRHDDAAFRDGN